MPCFVLIHSPLVGSLTWKLVSQQLEKSGYRCVLPELTTEAGVMPYWKQHVDSILKMVALLPEDAELVFAAHSGAGVLLPLIAKYVERPGATYIFVDADIPRNGTSRLDLFPMPKDAEQFRQAASAGLLPTWKEKDLLEVIPNPGLRRAFVAELHPLPLAVYEEPLPVEINWSEMPYGYIQFSSSYQQAAQQAKNRGWPYLQILGNHFHTLVDPSAVAQGLVSLRQAIDNKG